MNINDFFVAVTSKIISDKIDCTKNAIKKAVKQKAKGHNSLHIQMYNVIVETIEKIAASYDKNDDEKIYDAAETFLKLIKSGEGNVSYKIRKCLTCLDISPGTDDYQKFQGDLLEILTYDENRHLKRAIDLIRGNSENFSKNETKTSKANDDALCNKQQNKFQKNKKKNYCDIWNESLFLQHKDPGRIVRLRDAFVVPNYHIHEHKIGYNEDDTLENFIDKFIDYQGRSTMLITGVPGIGKSSIVSWIANKYEENDSIVILRFRDWENEDLEDGILNAVKKTLECNKMDLNDKTLILDGFDEIKALENREKLLQDFLNVVFDFNYFKCIITSRPHYIKIKKFDNYIELAPFDPQKVGEFYENIKGVKLNETISEDNIGVYGIPVILYMSIMCDLDITEQSSKPEIYNRIFAENGGIFDRFYFDEKAYSEGAHIFRNANNIEIYLVFLRETAYKLFKSNASGLILQKNDIPQLVFGQKNISILDFPLKPLFEGIEKVEFIHNSIYEYFVSEYIYVCICDVINGTKEELADGLGTILKDNGMSSEILEFLQYRIRNSELNKAFEKVIDTFNMMLCDGMTYYVNERCKPVIPCESNIFYNMLELLHLWDINSIKLDKAIRTYLFFKYEEKYSALKKRGIKGVCLRKINLVRWKPNDVNSRKIDLSGIDLSGSNLSNSCLRRTSLRGSDLSNSDLRGIDLSGSDLRSSDLSESDLKCSDLSGIDLGGADLSNADLKNSDLSGANLTLTNLRQTNLEGADLRGIDLCWADLRETNLMKVDLRDSNLKYVDLVIVNLVESNLRGVDLSKTNLTGVNLMGANLEEANLMGVDLSKTDLIGVNLMGANLEKTNLMGVDLIGANLEGANLRGVNLMGANLEGANLRGVNLMGANLEGANLSKTDLIGADLSRADFDMTIFDEKQIKYLEQKYSLQNTRVHIPSTNEIISYEEYCKRRNM